MQSVVKRTGAVTCRAATAAQGRKLPDPTNEMVNEKGNPIAQPSLCTRPYGLPPGTKLIILARRNYFQQLTSNKHALFPSRTPRKRARRRKARGHPQTKSDERDEPPFRSRCAHGFPEGITLTRAGGRALKGTTRERKGPGLPTRTREASTPLPCGFPCVALSCPLSCI
jgi:hypothetical protein